MDATTVFNYRPAIKEVRNEYFTALANAIRDDQLHPVLTHNDGYGRIRYACHDRETLQQITYYATAIAAAFGHTATYDKNGQINVLERWGRVAATVEISIFREVR